MGHGVVAPAVSSVVSPVVRTVATPVVYSGIHSGVYSGIHSGVYSGLSSVYGHYYAEREAEADPLVYTTGVHAPVVASTYAHGVVAPAVSNVVSTGYPYAHYGYTGHYYG